MLTHGSMCVSVRVIYGIYFITKAKNESNKFAVPSFAAVESCQCDKPNALNKMRNSTVEQPKSRLHFPLYFSAVSDAKLWRRIEHGVGSTRVLLTDNK